MYISKSTEGTDTNLYQHFDVEGYTFLVKFGKEESTPASAYDRWVINSNAVVISIRRWDNEEIVTDDLCRLAKISHVGSGNTLYSVMSKAARIAISRRKVCLDYALKIRKREEEPVRCPRCHELCKSPSGRNDAVSRTDNKTGICEVCGMEEAMEDYMNAKKGQ